MFRIKSETKVPECKTLLIKREKHWNIFSSKKIKTVTSNDVMMTSLRQPEFEGSVVGAGGNQFPIRRHVDTHHLKTQQQVWVPELSPPISSIWKDQSVFVPSPRVQRASSAASSPGDSKPLQCCHTRQSTGSDRLWLQEVKNKIKVWRKYKNKQNPSKWVILKTIT